MRTKRRTLIFITIGIVCILLAGCGKKSEKTDVADKETDIAASSEEQEEKTDEKADEKTNDLIGYTYQNNPVSLKDPVSGADLVTGNYYTVTLDDDSRKNYPELDKALSDFNSSEETGIREEMISCQNDAIEMKIAGADWSFENDRDFYPERADDRAFSFAMLKFSYLGGAHGTVSYYAQNIDPETGEPISFSTVVKDPDSLPDITVNELEKQNDDIKKYFEDMTTDRENLLESISERLKNDAKDLVWTVDYDGIKIYFEDYAMGSYAAGTQIVRIAFKDYPKLFTDTYDNYKGWDTPDIKRQAEKAKDADQNDLVATESMWDYNESDDTSDLPFYGLWVGSSTEKAESVELVKDLSDLGLEAYCIYTPEWENLNADRYWCVTVGRSETEAQAQALIEDVEKAGYKGAYVKYTGERLGHRIYYYMYTADGADITASKVTLNEVPTEELSGTEEDEGPMTLIVDSDTVFDKTCDMQSFPAYKDGESPLEWFNNVNAEHLMGVFEVGITGDHIDSFYGSYWWD